MNNNVKEKISRQNKGITLIALIITIIVLLILAGVSILMLAGENGILKRAGEASESTGRAQIVENARLAVIEIQTDNDGKISEEEFKGILAKYFDFNEETGILPDDLSGLTLTSKDGKYNDILASEIYKGSFRKIQEAPKTVADAKTGQYVFKEEENRKITDDYGNSVVIPEGFKIAEDSGTNIKEGIVIEDVDNQETKGNQFVWVPVGTVYKNATKETEEIVLSRYTFADGENDKDEDGNTLEKGTPIPHGADAINAYYIETLTGKGNGVAKETVYNAFTKKDSTGKTKVEKAGGYYIGRYKTGNEEWITQLEASESSKKMYNGGTFESDLTNSYAWDTAIVYIQKFSGVTDYSRRNYNSSSILKSGDDEMCKINDMSTNTWAEWTTENGNVVRGIHDEGDNMWDFYTCGRMSCPWDSGPFYSSYRAILVV